MQTHSPYGSKVEPIIPVQILENYIRSDIDKIKSLTEEIEKLAEAELAEAEIFKTKPSKKLKSSAKEEKMGKREKLEAGILSKLPVLAIFPSSIFPSTKLFEIITQIYTNTNIKIESILAELVKVADDRKMLGLSDLRFPQVLAAAAKKGPIELDNIIRGAEGNDLGQRFLRAIHLNPQYTKFRQSIIGPIFSFIIQALLLDLGRFAAFHESSEISSEKSSNLSFPYSEYTANIIFQVIDTCYFGMLISLSNDISSVPLAMLESGGIFYDKLEELIDSFGEYDLTKTIKVTFSKEELQKLRQDDTTVKEEQHIVIDLLNYLGGLDKNLRDLANACMSFSNDYTEDNLKKEDKSKKNKKLILPNLKNYFSLDGVKYDQALKNELKILISEKFAVPAKKEEKEKTAEDKIQEEKYKRYVEYRKKINSNEFVPFKEYLVEIYNDKKPYKKLGSLLKKFKGLFSHTTEISKFANLFNSFFNNEQMAADFPILTGYVFLHLHHEKIFNGGYLKRLHHEILQINNYLSRSITQKCKQGIDKVYKGKQSSEKTHLFKEPLISPDLNKKMEGEKPNIHEQKKALTSQAKSVEKMPNFKELLVHRLDQRGEEIFPYVETIYGKLSITLRLIPKKTLSNTAIYCGRAKIFELLPQPIVGDKNQQPFLGIFQRAFDYLDKAYRESFFSLPKLKIPNDYSPSTLAESLKGLIFYLDKAIAPEAFKLCEVVLDWLEKKLEEKTKKEIKSISDEDLYKILGYLVILALAFDVVSKSADAHCPLMRRIMLILQDKTKLNNALSMFEPQLLKIANEFNRVRVYERLFGEVKSQAEKNKEKFKRQLKNLEKGIKKINEGAELITCDDLHTHAVETIVGSDTARRYFRAKEEFVSAFYEGIQGSPSHESSTYESSSESPVTSHSDYDKRGKEEESENPLKIREMSTTTSSAHESSESEPSEKDSPSTPSMEEERNKKNEENRKKKSLEISKLPSTDELDSVEKPMTEGASVTIAPASAMFSLAPAFPAPLPPTRSNSPPPPARSNSETSPRSTSASLQEGFSPKGTLPEGTSQHRSTMR